MTNLDAFLDQRRIAAPPDSDPLGEAETIELLQLARRHQHAEFAAHRSGVLFCMVSEYVGHEDFRGITRSGLMVFEDDLSLLAIRSACAALPAATVLGPIDVVELPAPTEAEVGPEFLRGMR